MNNKVIEVSNLKKSFQDGNKEILILDNLYFDVYKGDTIAIVGSSGSGKSTFLQLIGGLDKQTSGNILFNNESLVDFNDNKQSEFRNKNLGFVFQFHHLLSDFTALENVMFPLLIDRKKEIQIKERAIEILTRVGLAERLSHYPSKLSGGEKQRVAIARALITNPSVILADEPTGNLDEETANEIMNLFIDIVKENNSSLIIVTHDKDLAKKCSKIFVMKNKNLQPLNLNI